MERAEQIKIESDLKVLAKTAHELKGEKGVCFPFALLAANYFHKKGFSVIINEGYLWISGDGKPIVKTAFYDDDYQTYGHWWLQLKRDGKIYTCDLAEWDGRPFFAEGDDYDQMNRRPVPKENFIWENVDSWGYETDAWYRYPEQLDKVLEKGREYGYDVAVEWVLKCINL